MILKDNNQKLLEQFKTTLQNLESQGNKARAQEEFLLKQLEEQFECSSLEEAIEFIKDLEEEKEGYDTEIVNKIEDIKQKMYEEGFL